MIHEFAGDAKLKISVYLRELPKGGTHYLAKDVPNRPFGETFRTVSFWHQGQLMVFPMEMIDHCILYEE